MYAGIEVSEFIALPSRETRLVEYQAVVALWRRGGMVYDDPITDSRWPVEELLGLPQWDSVEGRRMEGDMARKQLEGDVNVTIGPGFKGQVVVPAHSRVETITATATVEGNSETVEFREAVVCRFSQNGRADAPR